MTRGAGEAEGIRSALLDTLTLRPLVDIQVGMSGRRLACLDLRGKVGMEVQMGRSSAQREYLKPKEGMRSLRVGFQMEGCEINLVGHEQHFKKMK